MVKNLPAIMGDPGLIPESKCVFHGALRGVIVREKMHIDLYVH